MPSALSLLPDQSAPLQFGTMVAVIPFRGELLAGYAYQHVHIRSLHPSPPKIDKKERNDSPSQSISPGHVLSLSQTIPHKNSNLACIPLSPIILLPQKV